MDPKVPTPGPTFTGRSALLVESDVQERDRFGGWLEEAGMDVMTCPGPGSPDYSCVGQTEAGCPLVGPADVVILDLAFPDDGISRGRPGASLLARYLQTGKPLVALTPHPKRFTSALGDGLCLIRWPVDRESFLEAVRVALGRAERGAGEPDRTPRTFVPS